MLTEIQKIQLALLLDSHSVREAAEKVKCTPEDAQAHYTYLKNLKTCKKT